MSNLPKELPNHFVMSLQSDTDNPVDPKGHLCFIQHMQWMLPYVTCDTIQLTQTWYTIEQVVQNVQLIFFILSHMYSFSSSTHIKALNSVTVHKEWRECCIIAALWTAFPPKSYHTVFHSLTTMKSSWIWPAAGTSCESGQGCKRWTHCTGGSKRCVYPPQSSPPAPLARSHRPEWLSFWGQVQSVPGPLCCVFQQADCWLRSRHPAARYSLPERPAKYTQTQSVGIKTVLHDSSLVLVEIQVTKSRCE